MNVVHIAGQSVRIGTLLRQRCGWCGELMIDVNLKTLTVQVKPYEPGELYEGTADARADGFDLRPLKLESGGLPQTACVFQKAGEDPTIELGRRAIARLAEPLGDICVDCFHPFDSPHREDCLVKACIDAKRA